MLVYLDVECQCKEEQCKIEHRYNVARVVAEGQEVLFMIIEIS